MQTNTPTIRSFAYKYGIIISIITQIVNYVVSAVCIIIAIVSFRSANGGLLSVRQAVKLGTAAALTSGVVGVFYLLLFVNVIEPDFVEKLGAEVTTKQIAEKYPQLTSEQIQQQVDMQSQFFWVSYPFILIFSCLYGLVIGWITGLFAKKNQA
jgi:ABC-type antimicrobial peptide transport system permease subunit